MKKITVIFTALLGLVLSNSFAQKKSQNNNIWLHYVGKNKIAKKTFFTLEATMRYANGFSEKQQYFIRPSIEYQTNKHLAWSVGFTHYNTFVYGNPALNKRPIPENHIWIQANFTHQIGDLRITNRLRDENRWVGLATTNSTTGELEITDYAYRNRLRYMPLLTYPIVKKDKKTLLSAFVGDEAFINIGKKAGATLFNQNRIIAGLGYTLSKSSQVQLSFIQQQIWNFTDTIEESNPTLRISYLSNLDFSKH
ncbi:DUF2490 domain-containing protein [Lacihabitans soyangensis]|uniref:DUF2490 domain-containing protein n=1 Tax=Lacihabitans soyangensis TaxID=869394 RepID=A0AAE3H664_9BACT|nr:DUF2490 domain-containing protein [Lacihabitans soyangensis]MCP9765587.1 DUF2490 domain-containing protein [Lacihabitans soyangensis]